MNMQVLDTRRDTSGGYKVDVSRGSHNGRVSSEWFSRPNDQRYLSLDDLARSVRGRSERSRTRVIESALIHVEANRNDRTFVEKFNSKDPVVRGQARAEMERLHQIAYPGAVEGQGRG